MDTERASPRYFDLDIWAPLDIAEAMIEGQFTAVAAVRAARFALLEAALAAAAATPTASARLAIANRNMTLHTSPELSSRRPCANQVSPSRKILPSGLTKTAFTLGIAPAAVELGKEALPTLSR